MLEFLASRERQSEKREGDRDGEARRRQRKISAPVSKIAPRIGVELVPPQEELPGRIEADSPTAMASGVPELRLIAERVRGPLRRDDQRSRQKRRARTGSVPSRRVRRSSSAASLGVAVGQDEQARLSRVSERAGVRAVKRRCDEQCASRVAPRGIDDVRAASAKKRSWSELCMDNLLTGGRTSPSRHSASR